MVITEQDVEQAARSLTRSPASYQVYAHSGAIFHRSKRVARLHRWLLAALGCSASIWDCDGARWLVLQNSVERAGDANAEHAASAFHSYAEARAECGGYTDIPPTD